MIVVQVEHFWNSCTPVHNTTHGGNGVMSAIADALEERRSAVGGSGISSDSVNVQQLEH